MKFCTVALILFAHLLTASAKINGGPRGRFDPPRPTPTQPHVSAHSSLFEYKPPSHIYYLCRFCWGYGEYPVYQNLPPTYVYKFRECHSRFSNLLTGLALYNLGRASVKHTYYYTPQSDEECSMHVVIDEEFHYTGFPCLMMSTFIDQNRSIAGSSPNTYTIDITSTQHVDYMPYLRQIDEYIYYYPLRTGAGEECVLWYNTTDEKLNTTMPCGLLQLYGRTMERIGLPEYIWVPLAIAMLVAIAVSSQTCKIKAFDKQESDFDPFEEISLDSFIS